MTDGLKQHLPVIVTVTILGFITCAFVLMRVHDGAAGMDVPTFSTLIIVIPCAFMFLCSLVVAMTAHSIGRQLYVTMLAICFIGGLVSMVITSIWTADANLAAALLANSADGETISPATDQPILVLRNIAAYVVMPTLGCIAGAWIGSRLHPMEAEPKTKK